MTINITLNNVADLTQTTTAATTINNNSTTIKTGFQSALNTAGDQMQGSLDMNSNQIINLPAPATANSALRLSDLNTFTGGGTVTNIPSGGTTGQALTKTSNSNYAVGWSGVVSSVGLTAPSDFSVTNTPITTSGNIGVTWVNAPTGTGSVVRATSPTITTPTISGSVTGSGVISNTNLAAMAASSIKLNASTSAATATDTNPTALTAKATPVSADTLIIADSAASNALKSITIGGIQDFKTINVQKFTGSGTYTPTANMLYCIVEALGGGGGGGGSATCTSTQCAAASGGGAGGYCRKVFTAATIGVSQTVTIGAAGTGGAAGANNGVAGGNTTFGALLTANGGSAGVGAAAATLQANPGAPGGTASGGDVNVTGSASLGGFVISSGSAGLAAVSGAGASSIYGGGGALVNSGAGNAGGGVGSGGSGAATFNSGTQAAGGAGTAGFVIVTEYIH